MSARITGLQRSNGGVPKLSILRARVTVAGLEGDWQKDRKHHGGAERALCLYSQELIDQLVLEGHPMAPGATGENVTISGLDWRRMQPGTRVALGQVIVHLTSFAEPCRTIRGAFSDLRFVRIGEKLYPGWSRIYARVEVPGELAVGDEVSVLD